MSNTNQMPREEGIDHSLSLMSEGYLYILNRRHSFNSDIFETRLLGKFGGDVRVGSSSWPKSLAREKCTESSRKVDKRAY